MREWGDFMYREETREPIFLTDNLTNLPDLVKKTVMTPLHYGETLEIGLYRGIEGETFINGERFVLDYENVFFIPPRQPHTSFFRRGGAKAGDMVYTLHINMEALSPYLDVKKLLLFDNKPFSAFPNRIGSFGYVLKTVHAIMDEGRSFCDRLSELLRLLSHFSAEASKKGTSSDCNGTAIRIIDWIEKHYAEKLSVQNAAEHFGFSKFYFCTWFKAHTGVTFNESVNAVRIRHASMDLSNGFSIEETAERCGFQDPSYFIKVFKRFRGVTPKVYMTGK